MGKSDEDDDVPVLSSSALDALKEFYADRDARLKAFEDLKANVEDEAQAREATSKGTLSMEIFTENWNDSQFWYSDETAKTLAEELLRGTDSTTSIAVVSAPSVFVQIKNALLGKPADQKPKIYLLEFDERFAVFDEFVFYDFHNPLKLPSSMKGTIDHIICDPPFLSEDCQTRAAMTVRWLSKSWGGVLAKEATSNAQTSETSRLILCTGERMESLVTKLYRPQGLLTTTFEPAHSKGLSNEFYCYANFECDAWKWKPEKST
ncbi:putative N6-adenine methyltransferase-domain-containing protein [Xylogone sp. PMI_703]|nr:putative N6-adenine methyltransferase-domain-containing protein [Xylogone sp. PMI_703]